MSIESTPPFQMLMQSIQAGDLPSTAGWQITLQDGVEGWPADVRDLVSLGGDVVAAGNRWIIVTEELRDDIVSSTENIVTEPESVTILMLDDLPGYIVDDPDAMDQLQAIAWQTATGDAFVIPTRTGTQSAT